MAAMPAMSRTHVVASRRLVGALAAMWLCAACSGGERRPAGSTQTSATPTGDRVDCVGVTGANGPENLCQTLPPAAAKAMDLMVAPSYPVCGAGLGPSYLSLSATGTNQFLLGNDATRGAPTPAPVEHAHTGLFVLKVAPDCDRGDEIRIEPPSAAEIATRAPSADGHLAGVGIQAHVREFRIIGTGAVAFDQRVKLVCPTEPDSCPHDPTEDSGGYPDVSPIPSPWDPNLNP